MVAFLNFHTVAAFLTALLLGGMVLFAFLVTPTAFRSLGRDVAAPFISALFRIYYPYMALLSFAAALLLFYRIEAGVLAAVGAGFLFANWILRPAIERNRQGHRAGEVPASRRFRRLHAASVLVNLAQMLVVAVIFFRLAV